MYASVGTVRPYDLVRPSLSPWVTSTRMQMSRLPSLPAPCSVGDAALCLVPARASPGCSGECPSLAGNVMDAPLLSLLLLDLDPGR